MSRRGSRDSMTTIDEQRKLLLERMKAAGGGWTVPEDLGDLSKSQPPVERRSRKRGKAAPAKKKWTLPPKVRLYLPYVVIILAILTPFLHNPPRNNQVPSNLIGMWKTKAPGYEDRYILFVERNVAFGTGGYDGEAYIVAEVESSPVGDETEKGASKKTLYAIRYMKSDKLEYELSFYYEPEPVETITFKNQEHLRWTKKGSGS